MSGVGEALAILSLVIAVAEGYKKACKEPYIRFKKFPKVVRRYLAHFENQSLIYETHCENLLGLAIDQHDIKQMLACPDDVRWQDARIESQVAILLGKKEQACQNTLQEIKTLLQDNETEIGGLNLVLAQDEEVRQTES